MKEFRSFASFPHCGWAAIRASGLLHSANSAPLKLLTLRLEQLTQSSPISAIYYAF